jgi:uncharacterized repeat protein (TIGR02543 family)
MKKSLAILISVFLVLSMSATAFAKAPNYFNNIQITASETYTAVSARIDGANHSLSYSGGKWSKNFGKNGFVQSALTSITVTFAGGTTYTFTSFTPNTDTPGVLKITLPKAVYTATFVYKSAAPIAAPSAQNVNFGGKVTNPNVSATGWTFDGWYTNDSCTGPKYNFNTLVTGNVTLYGRWTQDTYSVTFSYKNNFYPSSVSNPSTLTQSGLHSGDKATDPGISEPSGWTFDGWYTNAGCTGAKYDFDAALTGSLILYGSWSYQAPPAPTNYTVTFTFINEGPRGVGEPANQTVTSGGTAVRPNVNEPRHWDFDGWYTSSDCTGTKYAFSTEVTGNVDLYGQWTHSGSSSGSSSSSSSSSESSSQGSSSESSSQGSSSESGSSESPELPEDETDDRDEVQIWGEITFAPAEETIEIEEEEVPLAGPNTGSGLVTAYLALINGISGMAYIAYETLKKR